MSKLARPWVRRRRIWDVSVEALAARGIRCVLFDLDNTLCFCHTQRIPQQLKSWMEQLHASGIFTGIISNGKGARVPAVAGELGVTYTLHSARKPLPFAFWHACKELGVKVRQCVMVGDQVFTDMLGARLAGMGFVLVEPLGRDTFKGTKLNRQLEWFLGRRPLRRKRRQHT